MDNQQIDRLYELIKSDNDPKARNERLLNMTNLLLEEINYSDSTLRSYEDKALLPLFSAYNKIARQCNAFYSSSNAFLNPSIKEGEFGRKLECNLAQIRQYSEQIEKLAEAVARIEQSEKDLLDNEKQLMRRKKDYEALQERTRQLQTLRNEASPEKLRALELQIREDEKTVETLRKKIDELKKDNDRLNRLLTELNSTRVFEDKKSEQLICDINSKIANIAEDIKQRLIAKNGALLELNAQIEDHIYMYNNMREQLSIKSEKAEQIKAEYEKCKKLYDIHLGENTAICKALGELNISSLTPLLLDSENVKNKIANHLSALDTIIKELLSLTEAERDQIRQLTGQLN